MSISRLSVSLPPEVESAVRSAAQDNGMSVSTWLADVAGRAAKIQQGRKAVAEWEAEHGRFTADERHEARQVLAELGVIEPMRSAG